jgi:hypothetical protein
VRPRNRKAFKRRDVGGHGAARVLPADVRKGEQEWVGGSGGLDGALNLNLKLELVLVHLKFSYSRRKRIERSREPDSSSCPHPAWPCLKSRTKGRSIMVILPSTLGSNPRRTFRARLLSSPPFNGRSARAFLISGKSTTKR